MNFEIRYLHLSLVEKKKKSWQIRQTLQLHEVIRGIRNLVKLQPESHSLDWNSCCGLVMSSVYLYYDSRLLAPVVCFAKLVLTDL